jgi:hypothetical protein
LAGSAIAFKDTQLLIPQKLQQGWAAADVLIKGFV